MRLQNLRRPSVARFSLYPHEFGQDADQGRGRSAIEMAIVDRYSGPDGLPSGPYLAIYRSEIAPPARSPNAFWKLDGLGCIA